MQLYTIAAQSKYMLFIEQIVDIEDAGDDFITAEEMCEMTGEEFNEARRYYFDDRVFRRDAIKEALGVLADEIRKTGKKSVLIKDDELLEVFKQGYSISEFAEGFRRVGNRLFLQEKKPNGPKKANMNVLAYRVQQTVNNGNKYEIEIKYASHDVPGTIALCKKLVSWEDILWEDNGYKNVNDETIGFCKQIWDNPNIFNTAKKEASPT